MAKLSIVIPAKDEEASLTTLLPLLKAQYAGAEILVVDDGSADGTRALCERESVRCISHRYPMGNGAAIKTGARNAAGEVLVFMDGDGQHRAEDVERLLEPIADGYDMAVGARRSKTHASVSRRWANWFYDRFSSWVSGHTIEDLTSGFRAVRAAKFREFLFLLPNGFSYPTTITMAFFRAGYGVKYVPIDLLKRVGKSHIRPLKDGLRFMVIIFKVGTLYSPLKIFLPHALAFFLTGVAYYAYTYTAEGRFTNMSALLLIVSVIVFLIGLVSEQITALMYNSAQTRLRQDRDSG